MGSAAGRIRGITLLCKSTCLYTPTEMAVNIHQTHKFQWVVRSFLATHSLSQPFSTFIKQSDKQCFISYILKLLELN